MDDSTSHEARAEAFSLARKGYDRRQVDAYREATEARVEALEHHIKSLEDNMSELGLARPTDLATELDVVGEEVKRILQEARVAAEQMRSRAADDAARWRAEADEESRSLRESSRVDAYETRRSVWETGSEMLTSAVDFSEAVRIDATERALFTQAEAERDASRLVGESRRERDESVGSAREEAERLVAAARQESDSITSAAQRQADAAQERARALEVRRAELMAELETARATIAGNNVASEPGVAPDEPTTETVETVTVVEATDDASTHWPDDEGSVKIVSPARVMTSEPVDADAMVAEIEAMRRTESDELPAASPQPEPESSSVPPAEGRGDAEEGSDELPAASSQPEPGLESDSELSLDPFALRERHLLPVQNRALRSVKRSLVEAQNQALEDLRLVEGWEPDGSIVKGEVFDALGVLARESMVVGFAAAAEMMDASETPHPDNVDPGDLASEFATALIDAAQGSVSRSRGAGAGHRETASALSRVFRSWRTDEAERRVQFASRTAYHIGVAAALADLGATDLDVTASGRPCRECPVNKGSWAIADGLPSGMLMPPARIECVCTIVPSH